MSKETPIQKVSKKSLSSEFLKFQKQNVTIPRKGEGKINGRSYKYATLDDILSAVRVPLANLDIMVNQYIAGDKVHTKIVYVPTGELLESDISIGTPSSMQDLGSRITYCKRYLLSTILGLSTEEDLDVVIKEDSNKINTTVPGLPGQTNTNVFPGHVKSESLPGQVTPMSLEETAHYKKAKSAVDACQDEKSLELLSSQIARSTKLSDVEKAKLRNIIDVKEHEITGVIR